MIMVKGSKKYIKNKVCLKSFISESRVQILSYIDTQKYNNSQSPIGTYYSP